MSRLVFFGCVVTVCLADCATAVGGPSERRPLKWGYVRVCFVFSVRCWSVSVCLVSLSVSPLLRIGFLCCVGVLFLFPRMGIINFGWRIVYAILQQSLFCLLFSLLYLLFLSMLTRIVLLCAMKTKNLRRDAIDNCQERFSLSPLVLRKLYMNRRGERLVACVMTVLCRRL